MAAASEGVRGNAGIIFTLKVKGASGSGTSYSNDLKSIDFPTRDKDDSDLTYDEALEGDTKVTDMVLNFIQSTVATSLHGFLTANPGAELDFLYGPHGNAAASVTKPHYTGTVKANGKPRIGVPARRSKDRGDSGDYTMECLTGPTLKTA